MALLLQFMLALLLQLLLLLPLELQFELLLLAFLIPQLFELPMPLFFLFLFRTKELSDLALPLHLQLLDVQNQELLLVVGFCGLWVALSVLQADKMPSQELRLLLQQVGFLILILRYVRNLFMALEPEHFIL